MKEISFFTGVDVGKVAMIMDKLENEYHMIKYNKQTYEIAIVHWAKYNLNKIGGKPVMDCISSELKKVKDVSLLKIIMEDVSKEGVRKLFLKEIAKREDNSSDKNKFTKNSNSSDNNKPTEDNKQIGDSKSTYNNKPTENNKTKMNKQKNGEAKKHEFGTYTKSKFTSRAEAEDDSLYEKPTEEQLRRVKELYN